MDDSGFGEGGTSRHQNSIRMLISLAICVPTPISRLYTYRQMGGREKRKLTFAGTRTSASARRNICLVGDRDSDAAAVFQLRNRLQRRHAAPDRKAMDW